MTKRRIAEEQRIRYDTATVEEIFENFKKVSRTAFYQAGRKYQNDPETLSRIEEAKTMFREFRKSTRKNKVITSLASGAYKGPRRIDGVLYVNPYYQLWCGVKGRCSQEGWSKVVNPTYLDCKISENFSNFEFFADWCKSQVGYGKLDDKGRTWHLDKDLLFPGNRCYSEDACVFLPSKINSFITYRSKGDLPVGVRKNERCVTFGARCHDAEGNLKYLGNFKNVIEAFNAYKSFKESVAKELAEKYKDEIDPRAYAALIRYEVLDDKIINFMEAA